MILILIQIGGLGVITIISGLMISLHRKIGIGALLYMTVFVPEYGAKGIWTSVFNSISAFCNAGIDIISEDSLCGYTLNPMINIVTSILVILGGIRYIVWWDVIKVLKNIKNQGLKCFSSMTLHSKIAVLIVSVFTTIKNKEDAVLFHRTISKQAVNKAVAVVSISFITMFISTVLLSAVTNADMLDIVYETVSATATVGLTRNLTSTLNIWGKIVIIITMYLGRVGPIFLFIAFNTKNGGRNIIKIPAEEISIG